MSLKDSIGYQKKNCKLVALLAFEVCNQSLSPFLNKPSFKEKKKNETLGGICEK